MHFDIPRVVGAVVREVGHREVDGQLARVVRATRLYPARADEVWDALTDPLRIPRWFAPVEGEFHLGGDYRITGNAHGEIIACEPPRHFALTWRFGPGAASWVHVTLVPVGDETRLELEHIVHPDTHWDKYGPGAVGIGWDLSLLGLASHLETGASVNTENAAGWMAGENGKAFTRQTGQAWIDASIAAGDDADWARESGARTIAFYGG